MTHHPSLPIRMISKIIPGFGRGSKELGIPTANLSRSDLQCDVPFDSLPCGIYWGFARIVYDPSHTNGNVSDKNPHDSTVPLQHSTKDSNDTTVLFSLQQVVHKAAISIGYNPCYSNEYKTIEPHLIAPSSSSFHRNLHSESNLQETEIERNTHPYRHASNCQETQYPDFYHSTIRLSIVGWLRPELPFESLDKLILAIKDDIQQTEILCDGQDEFILQEKQWVQSYHSVSF